MSLTKGHLIQSINKRIGMSKAQPKRTIENLFEILKENLANGEDVLISGLGKLRVKARNG